MLYGTYFPGAFNSVAVDAAGSSIIAAGHELGSGFPAKGLVLPQFPSAEKGIVVKLTPGAGNVCTGATAGSPSSFTFDFTGGSGTWQPGLPATCEWIATTNAQWLTFNGSTYGVGNQAISFQVAPALDHATRTATVQAGGQTVTVTQTGVACQYSFPQNSVAVASSNPLTSTFNLFGVSGCPFHLVSDSSWLTFLTSGTNVLDSTIPTVNQSLQVPINFAVTQNTGPARTAHVTLGNLTLTVTQAGPHLTVVQDSPPYGNSVAFTVPAGDQATQSTLLALYADGGGSYSYTATVQVPAGVQDSVFTSLSATTGTTPGSRLGLTIDPKAAPAPGIHQNLVSITTAGGLTITVPVTLTITPPGSTVAKAGVYRGSNGLVLLDHNADGICCQGDIVGSMGQSGDIALSGDWNGTGKKNIGLYRPGAGLFLLDLDGNGSFDAGVDRALSVNWQFSDVPVVGDWTGSGVDRAGVFRASTGTWLLDVNGDGTFTGRAYLGQIGDIPLVGKWGGGAQSRVGVYRPAARNGQPGNFFLIDSNGDGQYTSADQPLFFLGQSGDIPVVGDWNGNGRTKVGVFRPGSGLFLLDQNGNFAWDGAGADRVQFFQPYLSGTSSVDNWHVGDLPITGDWAPSYGPTASASAAGFSTAGSTRTGIYRPGTGTFFLDTTGDGTFQGRAYLGQLGDVPVGVPIVDDFGNLLGVNQLGNY